MSASKRKRLTLPGRGRKSPSPEWVEWRRQLDINLELVERLHKSTAVGGEKWRQGMIRHYTKLIDEAKSVEPIKYDETK